MSKDAPKSVSPRSVSAIGARLKATRLATGLSQADFCRQVGIATNTWNQYETGKGRPNLDFALKICDRFGVTLDWIYRGDLTSLPHGLVTGIQAHL